jgi:PTS system glucitol/sorbitol-specific IIC component
MNVFLIPQVQRILLQVKRILLQVQRILQMVTNTAQRILFLARCMAQRILFFAKRAWPVIKTILPPLIMGALVFAALNGSGLVRAMIGELSPVMGFVPAALLMLVISLIPVVSPLVGPGLLIAVLAVILTGEQIAAGAVTPLMALPAFCVIDALIGGKIIPRAFALGETEPETINAGVPVIFFTRLITIPAAVAAAYLFSFILFQS